MIVLFMMPISISYADHSVEQNQKVRVTLTLDQSMVDLSIDELKQREIIIALNMQGRYIVYLTNENSEQVMQVITRAEALDLGFVDDLTDLPKGKEIISIEIVSGDYYAVIRNEDESTIKQKISEEEATKISAQLQKEEDKHSYKETDTVGSKAASSGLSLPETATNIYHLLLIGGLMLLIGLIILFVKRKKLSSGRSINI